MSLDPASVAAATGMSGDSGRSKDEERGVELLGVLLEKVQG